MDLLPFLLTKKAHTITHQRSEKPAAVQILRPAMLPRITVRCLDIFGPSQHDLRGETRPDPIDGSISSLPFSGSGFTLEELGCATATIWKDIGTCWNIGLAICRPERVPPKKQSLKQSELSRCKSSQWAEGLFVADQRSSRKLTLMIYDTIRLD